MEHSYFVARMFAAIFFKTLLRQTVEQRVTNQYTQQMITGSIKKNQLRN